MTNNPTQQAQEKMRDVSLPTHTIHHHQCIYCSQHWSDCVRYPVCTPIQPQLEPSDDDCKDFVEDALRVAKAIYARTPETDKELVIARHALKQLRKGRAQ